MDPARWDRLETLFTAVVELPVEERTAYLDEACSDDPELRLRVESLLSASEKASGYLGGVIAESAADVTRVARPGQRVGAYEIVRELGRGGMGAVYLGRRADREYEAEVAIKLIGGFHTEGRLRRFRAERQILATLRHPNIAGLLDGGTTEDGVPYVVMEHVDGVPIDRYCEAHDLGIDERLTLFEQVCDAVAHAHRRLVVHCDLKPGNILVTPDGTPKLLDFGIARLLEPDARDFTTLTLRLGTPAYASPEQVAGEPVTVATDVHGLGVVLYELLTGRLPYPPAGGSLRDLERRILDADPVRPSAAVDDPERARRLRGDLDAVLRTALEKDPDRRYESVEQLAGDLRRHRARRPVRARPRTLGYRAGLFLRRHRVGVAVAAGALVLLGAFASAMAVQARRIALERDAAERARADAEQVSAFLMDLFQVDADGVRADALTAREVLSRRADRLGDELAGQPATRATMLALIGRVYENLGLYDDAGPMLDSALALRRATFGDESPEVAASLHARGQHLYLLGAYDSARAVLHDALAMRRRTLPPGDTALATTLRELAAVESDAGNYEAAESLGREALAIDRAALGDHHERVATGLVNLGGDLRRQGEYAAAEPLLREGLALRRELHGSEHLDVAHALNQLARLLVLDGRPAEARPYAQEGLEIRTKVLGPMHIEVGASLGNLAGILTDLGDLEGAIALRRRSLEVVRHNFGDSHPYAPAALQSLASVQYEAGRLDSARASYTRAIELQRELLHADDPNRGFALTGLGRVLIDLGRPAEAEPYLREALAVRRAGLPEGHWFTAVTELALGAALADQGRRDEARPLLMRAHETLRSELGADDDRTRTARARLAALDGDGGGPHGRPAPESRR